MANNRIPSSRRKFLKSSVALLVSGGLRLAPFSVGAGIIPVHAKADGGATAAIIIAAIQATISLASSLGAFGSRAGGMAQSLQAINIQLGQILRNQEVILEAISAVNSSIEALNKKVENLFQDERFKRAYDDALKIHRNIITIAEELLADPSKLESQRYYDNSFLAYRSKLQDAFTDLKTRVTEAKLDNGGVPLAVAATQNAYVVDRHAKLTPILG